MSFVREDEACLRIGDVGKIGWSGLKRTPRQSACVEEFATICHSRTT